MQRAPPSSNMVLVKADSGRDVNLVGIKDAASRNVIRVQAGHDCVLRRIRADWRLVFIKAIVVLVGDGGKVRHGVGGGGVSGGADHNRGGREERVNHLQIMS